MSKIVQKLLQNNRFNENPIVLTPCCLICLSIVTIFFLLTYVRMIYVVLLSLSHRRVTDELQTTIDESQTSHRRLVRTIDESQTSYRQLQTSHRWLQTSHRRVTDELQIQITPKVFSDTFIKHYFQKGYGFQTRWFLLKGGKSRTWCLLKCWKLFLTINQTMLSF